MAAKEKTKKKWTIKKEKEELREKMKTLRDRVNGLKQQEELKHRLLEEAGKSNDVDEDKMAFLRAEIADIKGRIKDTIEEYNNTVDVYNKLEVAEETYSRKLFYAISVVVTATLSGAGLALSHMDSVKGFIKNKEEDSFFRMILNKFINRT